MAYALFASSKLLYTGLMNAVSLQQSQRSTEQYNLATNKNSIQSQITDSNTTMADEKAEQYDKLADLERPVKSDYQGDDEAYEEALKDYDDEKDDINTQIESIENDYEAEIEKLNRQVENIGVAESAIEMEVKRLDTKITALQNQLKNIEDAENGGIERSTPKFKGVG